MIDIEAINIEAIDTEMINTVDLGIDDHHREDQQSTFIWKIQKILNLFFLHVGIKTVYIHHKAQFSLKKLYTNLSFSVDS